MLSRRDWRTNTRRHRLPAVLSLRQRRVAVVAVVCVARADSSFSLQVMTRMLAQCCCSPTRALSPSAFVVLAWCSLDATSGLTRVVIAYAYLCSLFVFDRVLTSTIMLVLRLYPTVRSPRRLKLRLALFCLSVVPFMAALFGHCRLRRWC